MKSKSIQLLATGALFAASALTGYSNFQITTLESPHAISFSGFTAPATWATPTPGAGQLDSNFWALDNDSSRTGTAATFGVDQTNGQGTSTGGVGSNGVYAFDVGSGVTALGFQPTGSFWAPGMVTLRIQNQTGSIINDLTIDWTVHVYNDQARANEFRFYTSADNVAYTHAGAAVEVVSPAAADGSPAWVATERSFSLSSLNLADGDSYYLRWGGGDVSGSGTRDEFGLSGISITGSAIPEPASAAALAGLAMLGLAATRRRSRSA